MKITLIECDQCIGPGIECRFQYHFICRILQLRPPEEMDGDRLHQQRKRIQDCIHFLYVQTMHPPYLGTFEDCFIFQPEGGC